MWWVQRLNEYIATLHFTVSGMTSQNNSTKWKRRPSYSTNTFLEDNRTKASKSSHLSGWLALRCSSSFVCQPHPKPLPSSHFIQEKSCCGAWVNEVSWVHCTPASNSQLQNSAAAVGVASTVGGQVSDEEGVVWQHIGDNKRGHEGRGRQEVWPRKAREWPNLVLWPAQ